MNFNKSKLRIEDRDIFYLLLLALALLLFYPDIFLARSASLAGDHFVQHYPWAWLLAQSLKAGHLPFWTPLIHCGFPITAEGQIGSFYLPNLILYFLLPIRWAYSYQNIVHFLISGFATYFYMRRIQIGKQGAFLAASVYLFSAAYGGAFYNMTSLKTLCWFPFSLYCIEAFLSARKKRYLVLFSFSMAMMLLAGYLQMALLAIFMLAVYILLHFFFASPRPAGFRSLLALAIFAALGFVLASPQLILSFELAMLSNRVNLHEAYAYVGSMSPLALLTFFFHRLQGVLRGNCFYSGIFPIFFVLAAYVLKPSLHNAVYRKIWTAFALIGLLLALGEWSPLYIALIKVTHFYSFRVPAKFLIFVCLSFAILTGIGWEALHAAKQRRESGSLSRLNLIFRALLLSSLAVYLGIYLALRFFRQDLWKMGDWLIRETIYGKLGHAHSIQIYHEKLNAILDSALQIISFSNPWNIGTFFLFAAALLLGTLIQKWKGSRRSIFLIFGLIFTDLYVYSWADIRQDFQTYQKALKVTEAALPLQAEAYRGKVRRVFGHSTSETVLPVLPSTNMLLGFSDIGAYSPFVLKRYYETIGQLGGIDDSNHAFFPSKEFVLERLPLLSSLGVSHIFSVEPLSHPDLLQISGMSKRSIWLYENRKAGDTAYFVSCVENASHWSHLAPRYLEAGFDPRATLLLEADEITKLPFALSKMAPAAEASILEKKQDAVSEFWHIRTNGRGFWVISNLFYPGWRATLNGTPVAILRAYGLFQAIPIPEAGEYRIEIKYHPFLRKGPF